MKVTFAKSVSLGGKAYAKGNSLVPDKFAYNSSFRKLVKSGQANVHPRSDSAITGQAAKDGFAAHNAAKAASEAQPTTLDAHEEAKAAFAKKVG